ncbi:hypothetical protein AR689_04800 [Arthrobacter sp. EpRS71]|nr:hypothetical protein AR689_04800 [Arthrobacter sp. EpRS71]
MPILGMDQQLYTIMEVSGLLKITRSHAYRLKKTQEWLHHTFGDSLRFSAEDIDAIKVMNRKKPPPDASPRRAPRIPKRP